MSLRVPSHLWTICASLVALVHSVTAQIQSVSVATYPAKQFSRTDLSVVVKADFKSPYESREIMLDLVVDGPSGKTITTPAFFVEGAGGVDSVWAIRFVPMEAGPYRGRCLLRQKGVPTSEWPIEFTVQPGESAGFLRSGDSWALRFDNGDAFRGIGYNLCWESRTNDDSRHFKTLHESRRFNYDSMIGKLAQFGGNFTRVWVCGWNFPLEWPSPWDTDRYLTESGRFNLSAADRLDEFVDRLERAGVYVMLALDVHGSYLGSAWEKNVYNSKNGGPADSVLEFFTSEEAKARYKDRLRYIVARWGYSTHIAAWEFFNEVDNVMYGVKDRIPDRVIVDWHREMSEYLRATDPNRHLITTSVSHRDVEGMNDIGTLDFNQRHVYGAVSEIPAMLQKYSTAHHKPYVIGEYGLEWDWRKDFNAMAPQKTREFKKGLWLGLFNSTPILPLSWWWEFFDDRGDLAYVRKVRDVSDRMLADGRGSLKHREVRLIGSDIQAYAVQTGDVCYLLLSNRGSRPMDAQVMVEGLEDWEGQLEIYQPGADATEIRTGRLGQQTFVVPGDEDWIVRLAKP